MVEVGDEFLRQVVDWVRSRAGAIWKAVAPHAGPSVAGGAVVEALDHVLLLDDQHLENVARQYVSYFNQARPHQGIEQRIPAGSVNDNRAGKVIAIPVLGGLHHNYRRAA